MYLAKWRAGIGLRCLAKVEVRVKVDYENSPVFRAGQGNALVGTPSHLMPTAQNQRQTTSPHSLCHTSAQSGLRSFQCPAFAVHVAGIPQCGFVQHWQVGQCTTQRMRPFSGARTTAIAAHALIHSEADQGHAALA
jgi:hypothetical protein